MLFGPGFEALRPFLLCTLAGQAAAKIRWDIDGADNPTRRSNRQPAGCVDQLADVTRPIVRLEQFQRLAVQRLGCCVEFLRRIRKVVIQQQWDVLPALPQWRRIDPDHVQSVKQVFAEAALFHCPRQVLVGCSDHPHVDFDRGLTANAVKLTFGQHPQQPGLQCRRHIADFIEEQRATIRLFKSSYTSRRSTGKCSTFMPEQFGLKQFGRYCRCVQGDKGFAGTWTVLVQSPRDQLLASAGFTRNQHGHAGSCQAADGTKHFLHGRCLADQGLHFRNACGAGVVDFVAFLPRCFLHQLDGFIDVEGFRQVFEGAALIGGDSMIEV